MDRPLNCNLTECNADLLGEAIATSCSHIFCTRCAADTGLTDETRSNQRVCPACQTYLPNKHDVVSNYLNPSEDWKANALSGLSSTNIIECAGKALSFWNYQMTMKMTFLEARNRTLQIQFDSMVAKYENALNDANLDRDNALRQVEAVKTELDHERQDHSNTAMALKEKSRKLSLTQELYDKIKRQAMLDAIDRGETQVLGPNLGAMDAHMSGMDQSEDTQQPTHNQRHMYNQVNSPRFNQQPAPHVNTRNTSLQQTGPSMGFGNNAYRGVAPAPHNLAAGMPPTTTQSNQRPRYPGGGLSAVHGVVAGTPRATPRGAPPPLHNSGSGGMRQPYLDPGQMAKNPPRFTGVPLGNSIARNPAGLASSRHAMNGAGTGGYDRGPGTNTMPLPSGYQNNRGGPGRY